MFVQLECFHSGLAIRSPAVLEGERVHDAHREGFMITRASRNENSRSYVVPTGTGPSTPFGARLVSRRCWPSMVAAEYGSPPEIAGHAGAGVGLYFLARPVAVH